MSTPPGWYPAADSSTRMQWWDGTVWTQNFEAPNDRDMARFFKTIVHPELPPDPSAEPAEAKINIFNARKIARSREAENRRLHQLVEEHGLLDVAELDAVKSSVQADIDVLKSELLRVRDLINAENLVLDELRSQILDVRQAHDLQQLGLYDFEHPAENSVSLSTQLEALRSQIKISIQQRTATVATSNFTFNNSAAKGAKFVKDMSALLLRAYNAEAENCVKSVRAGNLSTAQTRLSRVREQIARQGSMISLQITDAYHRLRLQELEIAARHLRALQVEKELEKERRAELAEQRKAEAELKREQERLAKEKSHYLATLAALEAQGDQEGIARMRTRLEEVEKAILDVDYRAANIRAGYVYVISNIGAFGADMVKIGMTRRLDPMDRVTELGDASVPFRFDVHALFFADDAVGVETMLHQQFAAERVNKVNLRKEFFRVNPAQVLEALQEHAVEVLEFSTDAEAPEYRLSSTPAEPFE
jgi:hypothetical protein